MDRVREALMRAERALARLEEVLAADREDEIQRDASIQRFEFTFEAVWKAARHVLRQAEGIDVASPKGVIRACLQVGLLTAPETEQALAMADDRNLTSHTYDEALAGELYRRLPDHAALMRTWLTRLQTRAGA
ncbi:nucleotidyltransferase [Alicyclobacillus cellulosilyticus]|uniref:Nucleotidyltransferase n=1 Tax=Alicyclobacillus cellulosilyticus TaxID=1003997 RepID=A0A917KAD5_9BACL|nr:HI0074 family nucleotidyltransferase substrate-binding subunit [Alicyclobacillus cellulosilyticus]GGJ06983.1 nucleotidyltransferase [Alicyclobacillus cellulosilyticus]